VSTAAAPTGDLPSLLSRIRAAPALPEILPGIASDLCRVFGSERMTIFCADAEGKSLQGIVRIGLERFGNFVLPVDARSVAGYAATHRRLLNIRDAYDAAELGAFRPPVSFFIKVDERSGYRTRELLTAPVMEAPSERVLGVVQLLNRLDGRAFPKECETMLTQLCQALAVPLSAAARQAEEARRIETLRQNEEERSLRERGEEANRRYCFAIESLRPLADDAFTENAPQRNAVARERLLQVYRRRFERLSGYIMYGGQSEGHPWHRADMEGLEWICRLAATGHVGAGRLLDRILGKDDPLKRENVEAGMLEPLAREYPRVAEYLVQRLITDKETDSRSVIEWLERAGEWGEAFTRTLRELYPAGGPMPTDEVNILRQHLFPDFGTGGDPRPLQNALLISIASERMKSPSREAKIHAAQLLERAARSTPLANAQLWLARYDLASDRDAFVREWLVGHRDPAAASSERQCMLVGMAIDRGQAGSPSGPMEALPWYVRGLGLEKMRGAEPGDPGPRTCMHIARAFDPRLARHNSSRWPIDEALARAWYERGLTAGSDFCFDAWLQACAESRLGITPDPDAALAAARRFLATGINLSEHRWVISAALRAVCARAMDLLAGKGGNPDAAQAARWLRVGALLEHDEALYRLGTLHAEGRGVAHDPQVARALFEKAAALGHAGAQAAMR